MEGVPITALNIKDETSFQHLIELFLKLEKTTSHKKIIDQIASYFEKINVSDVKNSAYLVLGDIGPKFEDNDLGIGDKTALISIAQAFRRNKQEVEKIFEQQGDLGDTAAYFNSKKTGKLTVQKVHKKLVSIGKCSGEGSTQKKIDILAELLRNSSINQSKYILRITMGNLRLGFGEQFLLEGLTKAFTEDIENKSLVEDKYQLNTDIGLVAESLAKSGIKGIKRFSISLGRPLQAMLAKRIDSLEELNKRFPQEMAVEEKYDGERVQIHLKNEKAELFSRRLEKISSQFPEIREGIKKAFKGKKAVLDGEIVAYQNNKFQSFQKLMHRQRKYKVSEYQQKIPVAVFLFDIVYLEGKSLLKKPYPQRRQLLEKNIRQTKYVKLAKRIVTSEFNKFEKFFNQSIAKDLEGVMIKSVSKDSIYQPGNRGYLWVKWKKEYAENTRDTFDLVIVGKYFGKGRRKETFGALLGALFNNENNTFETFTKVGTGFSDQQFNEIDTLLKKNQMDNPPSNVNIAKGMKPDIYIDPEIVIEVIGAEITRSPHHTAGKGSKNKGYALRFPRFLRLRTDKSPHQATTVEELQNIKES